MDYRILLQLQADVNGVKPADYSQLTLGGISPIALSSYHPPHTYSLQRTSNSKFLLNDSLSVIGFRRNAEIRNEVAGNLIKCLKSAR